MSNDKIPYHSLNKYLLEVFGKKVYKVSIDAGFTCPNRENGGRGCIFCSEGGSGEFSGKRIAGMNSPMSITEQIENGRALIRNKLPKDKPYGLIAYFQAYTNTYADVDTLREKYMEAISHPEVVAISVATRPDCLPEEVLDLLTELNEIKPVWVELGLQSIHEATAVYIRRGYPLSMYDSAVKNLRNRNLCTITHVILGLPYETREMMLETVKYVGESGVNGIKLQLLHVLKNTDLAKEYEAGVFEVLSEGDYIDLVVDSIKLLPENMVIHRMTGDGDKKLLIAPLWSGNKKHVLNMLSQRLMPI